MSNIRLLVNLFVPRAQRLEPSIPLLGAIEELPELTGQPGLVHRGARHGRPGHHEGQLDLNVATLDLRIPGNEVMVRAGWPQDLASLNDVEFVIEYEEVFVGKCVQFIPPVKSLAAPLGGFLSECLNHNDFAASENGTGHHTASQKPIT